jgi:hypothetical protein
MGEASPCGFASRQADKLVAARSRVRGEENI